ncbi:MULTISPECIES: acyl carrier protein [unclassified Streptomyces]|uniref:acyl carrier protein n=1 Tax=unclassified Streptomyces TaxID=2593676 RepID=UPI0012FF4508|nr:MULTISPECIES: acyl carrier protein [unclassified Streptomyces]
MPELEAPPMTVAEMTEVWTSAFGTAHLGAHDDFFDCGGHSLTAARISQQIEVLTGVRLPALAVFDNPTPAGLTQVVNRTLQHTAGRS